jgi:transketolase
MPSWELFEQRDKIARVLPRRSGSGWPWKQGSPIVQHKYVTDEGTTISMNRFGLSVEGRT